MIVVIPSSRAINLHYLAPLVDAGARFIIVDDTEGSIRIRHPQFSVYNWADRRRLLGPLEAAIPRRNGACRDLGFLIAWKESSDDEVVVALDDDCRVEDPDFADRAIASLTEGASHTASGSGAFFNILDLYEQLDGGQTFPRGFPYSARIGYTPWEFHPGATGPVAFNLGLWSNVLDVNAVDKLRVASYAVEQPVLRVPAAMVPHGALACLCSMNMQFRRRLIPAVYQLPMHIEVMPGWVVDRFGDIWGGFVLKTLMDLRGDRLSVGGPIIRHLQAGSLQGNIWQEHLAHLVNDEFVSCVRSIGERLTADSYLEMMAQLREELAAAAPKASPVLRAYLRHLDGPLAAWVTALRQA